MAKLKKEEAAAGEQVIEKKSKKAKKSIASDIQDPVSPETDPPVDSVLERKVVLSPIAVPLADAKLKKRTLKLVKIAAQGKQLKRGVREVVKALRKGSKGSGFLSVCMQFMQLMILGALGKLLSVVHLVLVSAPQRP